MTPLPGRLLVATAALALAVSPTPTGAAPASPGGAAGPVVTGYAVPSLPHRLLRREAPALDTVTVSTALLRPRGDAVHVPDDRAGRLVGVAHDEGLRAELLMSNWSNRLGRFDEEALHRLLAEPAHVEAVAAQVARLAVDGGWDGVNIDLERVREDDADGLVALATALRAALPDGASVTIDVSGQSSVRGYRLRGYDLAGLAAVVDTVQLMTYDQHGPGWSEPGPVGGLDWTRACLAAARESGVPAARLDVGVAGYGYLWRRDGEGRTVTPAGARRRVEQAGADARWHADLGEWSARLPRGTRLWWSDARSFGVRRDLAVELGLHGLAVWRLGSADRLPTP